MDVSNLPFNTWVGLSVDGDDVVLLPEAPHLNHLGSVHATVIFAAAEAATGQLLFRRFPDLVDTCDVVLRSCDVKYRRPAMPGAVIRGQAWLSDEELDSFQKSLTKRGRAIVEIRVRVVQDDVEVCTGRCTWFAATRSAANESSDGASG